MDGITRRPSWHIVDMKHVLTTDVNSTLHLQASYRLWPSCVNNIGLIIQRRRFSVSWVQETRILHVKRQSQVSEQLKRAIWPAKLEIYMLAVD